MFDFSFTEMLLSGVVALVVLGPERLPKVARKAGEWVGKIQRLAAGVKQELAANGEYAELSKVKQDFTSTVADLKQELHDFGKQVEQETQTIAQHTQELAQQLPCAACLALRNEERGAGGRVLERRGLYRNSAAPPRVKNVIHLQWFCKKTAARTGGGKYRKR